jgi:hypothetical protein
MTRPAVGNAMSFQPAFIGPQWSLLKRYRSLRAQEDSYCRCLADTMLEEGKDCAWLDTYLDGIVRIRELLRRLDEYERCTFESIKLWRDAADAAGADLETFTLPVEAAA